MPKHDVDIDQGIYGIADYDGDEETSTPGVAHETSSPDEVEKAMRKKPYGHKAHTRTTQTGKIVQIQAKGSKPTKAGATSAGKVKTPATAEEYRALQLKIRDVRHELEADDDLMAQEGASNLGTEGRREAQEEARAYEAALKRAPKAVREEFLRQDAARSKRPNRVPPRRAKTKKSLGAPDLVKGKKKPPCNKCGGTKWNDIRMGLGDCCINKSDAVPVAATYGDLVKSTAAGKVCVVGHTSSGKAIMSDGSKAAGFSTEEHREAGQTHSELGDRLGGAENRRGYDGPGNWNPAHHTAAKYLRKIAQHHRDLAGRHYDAARKMEEEAYKRSQLAKKSMIVSDNPTDAEVAGMIAKGMGAAGLVPDLTGMVGRDRPLGAAPEPTAPDASRFVGGVPSAAWDIGNFKLSGR